MSREKRQGRLGHPLFVRMYVAGLVLLALGLVAALTAGALLFERGAARGFATGLVRYLSAEVQAAGSSPAELEPRLARLHEAFALDLAIYDGSAHLVASAGSPPPLVAPPGSEGASEAAPVRFERGWPGHRGFRGQVPLGSEGLVLVAAGAVRQDIRPRLHGLVLLVVLAAVALLAWPLARGISRPLEALTRTARRLGAGELSARSNIRRHDEIGELAQAFDDMGARLEALMQSERELLANVSHELRTPLARIRVALELMDEQTADPAAIKGHLGGVGADLGELERLVEDVLSAARLNSPRGALPLRREAVAVASLLEEAAGNFRRNHPEHVLRVAAAPAVPEVVGDAVLLRRLLDNLLDNAGRYAPAASGPVELEAVASADGLAVEVRDRGPGVESADLPRLFEPFFRTDRSRARHSGGLGLGLALCKRIAEAHAGRLTAERREGGGLVLRLELPLDAPS
jgi:two-component system, OmpR family, sensor kinase